MKNFLRFTTLFFFLLLPSVAFANDISGNGWVSSESDGDKTIYLFDKDKTFTYLGVISITGNQGKVFGDNDETWELSENGNLLVISFNNGYRICSLKRQGWNQMKGDCINKKGRVEKITLKLIE
tara:strand:- start:1867 stop:2238 length:372 start_codon:yes stop_codon:yes gene_type:complete